MPDQTGSLSAALYRIAQGVEHPAGAALDALERAGRPTPAVHPIAQPPAVAMLGEAVRDRVCGFEGIVTEVVYRAAKGWYFGVEPVVAPSGAWPWPVWVDAERILRRHAAGAESAPAVTERDWHDFVGTRMRDTVTGMRGTATGFRVTIGGAVWITLLPAAGPENAYHGERDIEFWRLEPVVAAGGGHRSGSPDADEPYPLADLDAGDESAPGPHSDPLADPHSVPADIGLSAHAFSSAVRRAAVA